MTSTAITTTHAMSNPQLAHDIAVIPLPQRLRHYVAAFESKLMRYDGYSAECLLRKAVKMDPLDADVLRALTKFPTRIVWWNLRRSDDDDADGELNYSHRATAFCLTNQLLTLFRPDGLGIGSDKSVHKLRWPLHVRMVTYREYTGDGPTVAISSNSDEVLKMLTTFPCANYVNAFIDGVITSTSTWSVLAKIPRPKDHWANIGGHPWATKKYMWYELVVENNQLYIEMTLAYQLDATQKACLVDTNYYYEPDYVEDGVFESSISFGRRYDMKQWYGLDVAAGELVRLKLSVDMNWPDAEEEVSTEASVGDDTDTNTTASTSELTSVPAAS